MVDSVGAVNTGINTTVVTPWRRGDNGDNCLWNIVKNHYDVSETSEKIKACEAIAEYNGFDSINDTIYVGDVIMLPELTYDDKGKITGYVEPEAEQAPTPTEAPSVPPAPTEAPSVPPTTTETSEPEFNKKELNKAASTVADVLTSAQPNNDEQTNAALKMTAEYLNDESISDDDKKKFIEQIYNGVKDEKGYNYQDIEQKMKVVEALLCNTWRDGGGDVSKNAKLAADAINNIVGGLDVAA